GDVGGDHISAAKHPVAPRQRRHSGRGGDDRKRVDQTDRAFDRRLISDSEWPAAEIVLMNDVDLIVDGRAVVGGDQALIRRVPEHVERVPETAGELLDAAVRKDSKDLSAVPVGKRSDLEASVIADAEEDRAISGDGRIPPMMFGR